MVLELKSLEVKFMDVIKEIEDDVLSVIVDRRHDEIGSSNEVSELVELVLIEFVNVGFLVLLVVSFSSEDEHSIEVQGDDTHSVLSDVNHFAVLSDVLHVKHSPA
jgi:hypothetical protein